MRFFRARPVLVNMAMNKTKKVLMKTSHCDTPNGRLSYAKVSAKVYVVEYIDCHIPGSWRAYCCGHSGEVWPSV